MKPGTIVKFKGLDGRMNGGTIVVQSTSKEGKAVYMINTLDGQKVQVAVENCVKIPHQITGKQTNKFKEKVIKEIKDYNRGLDANPSQEVIESYKVKLENRENEITQLKGKIIDLEKELKSVQYKLEESQTNYKNLKANKADIDTYIDTIKSLESMLIDNDTKYQPMIDLINKLISIK